MKMFYIQYEVRPLPDNADFSTAGGAYANCYVIATSAEDAVKRAYENFSEQAWEVVAVEEEPVETARECYLDDPEILAIYDDAVEHGECYVYHMWPIEPQDDDAIH
jgi:hypothetical protein